MQMNTLGLEGLKNQSGKPDEEQKVDRLEDQIRRAQGKVKTSEEGLLSIFQSKKDESAEAGTAPNLRLSIPGPAYNRQKKDEGSKLLAKRVTRGVNYFTGSLKFRHVLSRPQTAGDDAKSDAAQSPSPTIKRQKQDDGVDSVLADAEKVVNSAVE